MSMPRASGARRWPTGSKWTEEARVFPLHCSTFEQARRHGPWHQGTPVSRKQRPTRARLSLRCQTEGQETKEMWNVRGARGDGLAACKDSHAGHRRRHVLGGYGHTRRRRFKICASKCFYSDLGTGGEGGIRTRGGLLTHTRFPGVRLKPLIHLSSKPAIVAQAATAPLRASWGLASIASSRFTSAGLTMWKSKPAWTERERLSASP
jgi:hypothetical protein